MTNQDCSFSQERELYYLFFLWGKKTPNFKIIPGLPSLNPVFFFFNVLKNYEMFSFMLQYEKFTLKREIHWLVKAARE